MPFDIDSFSRYLCFMMPQKIPLPPEFDSKSFQIGVDSENLSFVIDQLHKMYEPEFTPVIILMRESRTHTDTFFMKKVVSKCLKLSENAITFTHFLLVCTLIAGVVKDHLESAHCFFYPSLSYYCLISVYNRCYKDFFASKEESDETLDSFITNLRELLSVQNSLEDSRSLPLFKEINIATVLENLIAVEYRTFQLTEYEQESLEDLPALLPIVQCSEVSQSVSKSTESLSESSSCKGIATGDATESESMDEDSTSRPSDADSVGMDSLQSESNDADCSGMTSFSSSESKSSSTVNKLPSNLGAVVKEGLPKSVSMNSDTTTSELRSSSSIDTNTSSMDDVAMPMLAEWEHYRERICDFCKSRCAVLPVNYIAKTLEGQISEGKILN